MIVVVIPSRGRPERARDVIDAIRATAVLDDTQAIVAADRDDPEYERYVALIAFGRGSRYLVSLDPAETGDLVRATNTVALRIATADPTAIIANWGDDHMPRTVGWDLAVTNALRVPGIAYGDDLIQGEHLPTAPFISAEIVTALGYYFLPDLEHMYVDNVVRDIAEQAGIRRYLPDVVIEHMHPAVGKAPWDDGYIRVNADDAILRDRARYESWREHAMAIDVGRVRDALAVAA